MFLSAATAFTVYAGSGILHPPFSPAMWRQRSVLTHRKKRERVLRMAWGPRSTKFVLAGRLFVNCHAMLHPLCHGHSEGRARPCLKEGKGFPPPPPRRFSDGGQPCQRSVRVHWPSNPPDMASQPRVQPPVTACAITLATHPPFALPPSPASSAFLLNRSNGWPSTDGSYWLVSAL